MRSYSESKGRRDVHQVDRLHTIRVFTWSLTGAILGGLLGVFGAVQGSWGILMVLVLAFVGWAVAFTVPLVILGLAGRASSTLYNPSGRSTPRKREYSHAESLVVRGLYEDAVEAFTLAIAEHPDDPTPYLRIARVYRDRLGRHEEAAHWFKQALGESVMPPGLATLTHRELAELFEQRMGQPRKAAPIFARMAEELAGTAEGDRAAQELARIKALIAAEEDRALE